MLAALKSIAQQIIFTATYECKPYAMGTWDVGFTWYLI